MSKIPTLALTISTEKTYADAAFAAKAHAADFFGVDVEDIELFTRGNLREAELYTGALGDPDTVMETTVTYRCQFTARVRSE